LKPTTKGHGDGKCASALCLNNIVRDTIAMTYGAGASGDPTFTQGAATAVDRVQVPGQSGNRRLYRHLSLTLLIRRPVARDGALVIHIDLVPQRHQHGHFNAAPATLSGLILRATPGDGRRRYSTHSTRRNKAGRRETSSIVANTSWKSTSAQNNINSAKRTARLDFTPTSPDGNPFRSKAACWRKDWTATSGP